MTTLVNRFTGVAGASVLMVGLTALGLTPAAGSPAPRSASAPWPASVPWRSQGAALWPGHGAAARGLRPRSAGGPLASGIQGELNGTAFLSPGNGWAVGFYCPLGCEAGFTYPYLEHWNGTKWSAVLTPSPTPFVTLTSVSVVSAKDAWAVGAYISDGAGHISTLIMHWNGDGWHTVPSPNPRPGVDFLESVTASSATSAWAVGYFCARNCGNRQVDHTLILHWNGRTWSRVPSPNPGADLSGLFGVTAVSPASAWAVGDFCARNCGNRQVNHTLILHWNGRTWSQVPSPNPGTYLDGLSGVTAMSRVSAWAVGAYCPKNCGKGEVEQTLILHWDGRTWSQAPNSDQGKLCSILYSVTARSARDAWAVGESCTAKSQLLKSLILHWNGAAWSAVAAPNLGENDSSLVGVTALSATRAWAVGVICAKSCDSVMLRPLVLRWDGKAWSAG